MWKVEGKSSPLSCTGRGLCGGAQGRLLVVSDETENVFSEGTKRNNKIVNSLTGVRRVKVKRTENLKDIDVSTSR